jgi:hypothetical protein
VIKFFDVKFLSDSFRCLFRQLFIFFQISFLLSSSVIAQNIIDSNIVKNVVGRKGSLQHHPRLLWFDQEEKEVANNREKNPSLNKIHLSIISECENLLNIKPVERTLIGVRLLDQSREALRRLFYLSYAYRATADKRYAERAEKEMLAIASFSDWNPRHFLDVAEMTMAMAIGYDWVHSYLSSDSRELIKEAIVKKGLEPSFYSKHNNWLNAKHNWNQVCNAGMVYGALAVHDDYPDLAKNVVQRALQTIHIPMKSYAPDGAYPEGYGYWGYGTTFNVLLIDAVNKVYGTDFGMSNFPGFLATAGYFQNMTGPTGKPFNYADCAERSILSPAMFWFASYTGDPSLLWVQKGFLEKKSHSAIISERMLPALLVWYGKSDPSRMIAPKQKTWTGGGENPVAMMRTSWTDTSAIYVGVKGGSPSTNHGHMDAGSFVMDAEGVRWAMDFGMQDYESLESKRVYIWGKEQDAQRWSVFRYTNLVHNTLTINNRLQSVDGNATIVKSSSKKNFMNAVVDLSSVYRGELESAERGIAIIDQEYVLVRDEVKTAGKSTTIRWTMLTPATVEILDSTTAMLTKSGKKLLLKVDSGFKSEMRTWTTDPPNQYDEANPGTTLVGFEMIVPPGTVTAFNVFLFPGGKMKEKVREVNPLKDWK